MIKPVKRNKRLKWIDSHYAKELYKPMFTITADLRLFKKGMKKVKKSLNRFMKVRSRKAKGRVTK